MWNRADHSRNNPIINVAVREAASSGGDRKQETAAGAGWLRRRVRLADWAGPKEPQRWAQTPRRKFVVVSAAAGPVGAPKEA